MDIGQEDTDNLTLTVVADRNHNPYIRLRRRASAPEQLGRESFIWPGDGWPVRETARQSHVSSQQGPAELARPNEGASAQERASEAPQTNKAKDSVNRGGAKEGAPVKARGAETDQGEAKEDLSLIHI